MNMKNTITNISSRITTYFHLLASGALIVSFLPISALHTPLALLTPAKIDALKTLSIPTNNPAPLVDEFFGTGTSEKVSQPIIDKQIELVSTRGAFPASLAVIKKHEAEIRAEARAQGVPEDVALGVSLLENGGSETAVSSAGALGIFQLMPGTARSLGLTVNKKVDDRKNVSKSIAAGVSYLKMNYDRFGDWGLATWAYHAGEGNVAKALKLYAKANSGVNLVGLKEAPKLHDYVANNNVTIHKLLSSAAVKPMTKKLSDDSAGYPYKVIATATLFEKSKSGSAAISGVVAEK
jgi:soluble lytic murein transglycosylase-like protein